MINNKTLQQLDLNLLKVFQALYQEQSMTRTAEVLHITPSAVSHAIKRLRAALDDPLFVRSQNTMQPTIACQRMAPLIIDNLARLQQILQQWGEFSPTESQHHFRIGIHSAFEAVVLPNLIKKSTQYAPNIHFSSINVQRNNLLRELTAGHVDIVLDISIPTKAPLIQQRILEDNFSIMMRKDHPLRSEIGKKQYLEAKHINVSNRPSGATMEDRFFAQKGHNRHIGIRCQNYYAARDIAKSSDLLLTLPTQIAKQLAGSDTVISSVPFRIPSFHTSLYWHQNTQDDAALSWLRTFISQLFPQPLEL